MPNVGVLLLTKERGEDDEAVRKLSQYHLIPSVMKDLFSSEVMVRVHYRKHGGRICKHQQTRT